MKFGKIIGNVISTVKTGKLDGIPLHVVQILDESLKPTKDVLTCTDTVNAKHGEIVLVCGSSSSRLTAKTRGVCTDSTIIAIVDTVSANKNDVYHKYKEQ